MTKIEMIPLELVNILMSNHNGTKKTLMEGNPIKIQQKTKDVLMSIKDSNKLASVSNAIDLLISVVAMYQVNDARYSKDIEFYDKSMKKDIARAGVARSVIIKGREFYSLDKACTHYKISRMTLMRRIKSMKTEYRHWNYADEDLEHKYRKVTKS